MNTKEIFKRVLIIILLMFLLLGTVNIKSFANIKQDDKGTIEVSGVEPKVEVSVYRLTNVDYDFDGSNQPYEPPYEWISVVKEWLQTNYKEYVDPEKFQETIKDDSVEAANFYDHLASAIKSDEIHLDATATTESESGTPGVADKDVSIPNLDMGTYLVLIENGYKVYRPSVVNLVPDFNGGHQTWEMTTPAKVTVKSSEPTIQKVVTDNDVSTTDKITYTLTADVPNFPEKSIAKNYYISDIFGNGLTYVGNVKVYGVEGDETELNGESYTLKTEDAKRPCGDKEATTFTIEFKYEKIKEYSKVKVVYEAKLNQDDTTVLAGNGNLNKVYLDYSNNPYEADSWNSKENQVGVYTYEIAISKVDKDTKNALSGAQFTLSTSNDGSNPIKFKKSSDGTYYKSDEEGAVTVLDVGAETENIGNLKFRGLDTGTYYLTETKAPDGYNKIKESIEIAIKHGSNVSEQITNNKGFILPLTGGIGTTVFTVAGSVLFGLGLLLGIAIIIKKSNLNKDIK